MTVVFNFAPEDIIEDKIIGFKTERDGLNYKVYLMKSVTIKHPQAPTTATVHKFDLQFLKEVSPVDKDYGAVVAFHGVQESIRDTYVDKST